MNDRLIQFLPQLAQTLSELACEVCCVSQLRNFACDQSRQRREILASQQGFARVCTESESFGQNHCYNFRPKNWPLAESDACGACVVVGNFYSLALHH
jgi:hypothetical protein